MTGGVSGHLGSQVSGDVLFADTEFYRPLLPVLGGYGSASKELEREFAVPSLEADMARVLAEVWAMRDPMPPDRWAEQFFELPERVSDARGLYDFTTAPHVRGILQLIVDPNVREITLMMASQTAKTTILLIIAFWIADQDPGPTMLVWPTREIVERNVKGRLRPAIAACARINRLVGASGEAVSAGGRGKGRGKTERADSLTMIRFLNSDLFVIWSQSESQRRSTPAMTVIIDEFESCDSSTLADARDRVTTYGKRGKIIKAGVPGVAGDGLDQQYELSDKREFWRPCPAPFGGCGHYQVFRIEQIRWEGGYTCSSDQAERTGYVECAACQFHIQDHHKNWMNARGVWANQHQKVVQGDATPENPDPAPRVEWLAGPVEQSAKAGVHFPAVLAPLVSLSTLVAELHECQGTPTPDFITRRGARGYRPAVSQAELKTLRERRRLVDAGGYRMRWVPREGLRLMLVIDVQHDVVWWTVFAIGRHGAKLYVVDHGMHIAPQGEDLVSIDGIAEKVYPLAPGHPGSAIAADGQPAAALHPGATMMRITAIAIDEGHRPKEVMAFRARMLAFGKTCYTVKGWEPTSTSAQVPWKFMYERTPAGKPMSTVPLGFLANSGFWKSYIAQRLTPDPIASSEQLSWILPEDTPDEYIVQLTAEHMVAQRGKRGTRLVWQAKSGRNDNHFWDIMYYAACYADLLDTKTMERPVGLVWPPPITLPGTSTPAVPPRAPAPPPTPVARTLPPRVEPRDLESGGRRARSGDPLLRDDDPLGPYRD